MRSSLRLPPPGPAADPGCKPIAVKYLMLSGRRPSGRRALALEAAERAGDVARNGGLLGDDEGFCHGWKGRSHRLPAAGRRSERGMIRTKGVRRKERAHAAAPAGYRKR